MSEEYIKNQKRIAKLEMENHTLNNRLSELEKKLKKTIQFTTNHIELQLLLNEYYLKKMKKKYGSLLEIYSQLEEKNQNRLKEIIELRDDFKDYRGETRRIEGIYKNNYNELKESLKGFRSQVNQSYLGEVYNIRLNNQEEVLRELIKKVKRFQGFKHFPEAKDLLAKLDSKPPEPTLAEDIGNIFTYAKRHEPRENDSMGKDDAKYDQGFLAGCKHSISKFVEDLKEHDKNPYSNKGNILVLQKKWEDKLSGGEK